MKLGGLGGLWGENGGVGGQRGGFGVKMSGKMDMKEKEGEGSL